MQHHTDALSTSSLCKDLVDSLMVEASLVTDLQTNNPTLWSSPSAQNAFPGVLENHINPHSQETPKTNY